MARVRVFLVICGHWDSITTLHHFSDSLLGYQPDHYVWTRMLRDVLGYSRGGYNYIGTIVLNMTDLKKVKK